MKFFFNRSQGRVLSQCAGWQEGYHRFGNLKKEVLNAVVVSATCRGTTVRKNDSLSVRQRKLCNWELVSKSMAKN